MARLQALALALLLCGQSMATLPAVIDFLGSTDSLNKGLVMSANKVKNPKALLRDQVEYIYFTKDRFLGVTIKDEIHWIGDTLITVSCAVAMLKRLNVDFIKKSHKWDYFDVDGVSPKYKSQSMIKVKIDDEELFDFKHGYLTRSKQTPTGSYWWTIQQLEDAYFNIND